MMTMIFDVRCANLDKNKQKAQECLLIFNGFLLSPKAIPVFAENSSAEINELLLPAV